MQSFGRAVAAFLAMMVLGYIAVVALVPRSSSVDWRADYPGGQSAALRLSEQAQALAAHKSPMVLQ